MDHFGAQHNKQYTVQIILVGLKQDLAEDDYEVWAQSLNSDFIYKSHILYIYISYIFQINFITFCYQLRKLKEKNQEPVTIEEMAAVAKKVSWHPIVSIFCLNCSFGILRGLLWNCSSVEILIIEFAHFGYVAVLKCVKIVAINCGVGWSIKAFICIYICGSGSGVVLAVVVSVVVVAGVVVAVVVLVAVVLVLVVGKFCC